MAMTHLQKQSETPSQPFRWEQLQSSNNYRLFVANLRAIGCPEPTIEDIVKGATSRTFAWEREQLNLDGSGNGPWSQSSETQMVESLLGESTSSSQIPQNGTTEISRKETAENTALTTNPKNQPQQNNNDEIPDGTKQNLNEASSPLFLQHVNWSALGFDADQQTAIAQARQQFLDEINNSKSSSDNSANPDDNLTGSDSGDSKTSQQWQAALQSADDALRASLGIEGYEAYQEQQYWNWYQPQVMAHVGNGNLVLNPDAFSISQ